ncbi:MAG: alkaline phosphatase family protein [Kineosporiaceae bacterium]
MNPATLADVLPSVAAALGSAVRGEPRLALPPARRAVVVLLDGLGERLLARRSGHAPFLRSHPREVIGCGFPSTTATSMGTFGTGTLPGTHGLVGLDVLDPARDVLFSELAWDPLVDPVLWQPGRTVFEDLVAVGIDVVRVGPAYFDGSGLTEAALRGGRFMAGAGLQDRLDATLAALASFGPGGRGLVYLYWGEIDKVGHERGCDSWQWGEELAVADAALQQLVERVGHDTLVVVTADHGMVDVSFENRLDVAHDDDLAAGVRHVGGEPRGLHLYCVDGARADVLAAWRERLGERMDLRTRDEAIAAGWFGAVHPRVAPRIGDVVGSALGPWAVIDSRTARPEILRLIGLHGARTDDELQVPLLAVLGGR